MKSAGFGAELLGYVFLRQKPSFDRDASLELALHTGDPGARGTAATNEAAYPGYSRVPVRRAAAGWTLDDQIVRNAALVRWPTCEGDAMTRERITHWSIVRPGGGAAMVLYRGELEVPLDVAQNIRPELEPGDIEIRES